MKKLFCPNINGSGRLVRGVCALAFLLAGIFIPEVHWFVRIALFISAAFVGFEAISGWCALRACGIRTRC